ncbi:hypothetical protein ACTJIJ_10770 [Niabella sp. 22666]|uniref:hypothetical protein n=1 Tax=Niabella sp. 22666 TaxID=3453954 RepID=UPI003F8468EB
MKKLLVAAAMMASALSVNAQSLFPNVATSPQAEAFKMYGEYGINYSTGMPDISIPLFTVEHRGYKLPLSLNYIAQPVKPGYNYDVFGLGWSLSARSSISRSIEYLPDEERDFALDAPPPAQDYSTCMVNCFRDYNYAHDKFSAVLPDGSSFDFIIKKDNNQRVFMVSEGRKVQISCVATTAQITSFTVIDESGVTYTFSGADTPHQGNYSTYMGRYVSWMLTRIDLPHSSEPIYLSYDYLMETPSMTCGETFLKIGHWQQIDPFTSTAMHHYKSQKLTDYPFYAYKMRLLTSISYGTNGNNEVRITYKNPSGSSYNYAEKMKIYEGGTVLKEISFNTTANTSNSPCYAPVIANLNSVSVKEGDAGTSGVTQTYQCSYHSRSGFGGTDHWGYLNGIGNDMPNFTLFTESNVDTSMGYMSAIAKEPADVNPYRKFRLAPSYFPANIDCRAPLGPQDHGVLQRITYPTGGYTEFEFQNHKFLSSSDANGNYIYDPADRVSKNAAGFRIWTIANYTQMGVLSGKKRYEYGKTLREALGSPFSQTEHTGLGQAVADPNILTYSVYEGYPTMYLKNMILGLDEYGQRQPFTNPFLTWNSYDWEWECTVSPSNFRRLLNGRSPVIYPQVTVFDEQYDGNGHYSFPLGKTVYKYMTEDPDNGYEFFEQPVYFGSPPSELLSYNAKSFFYNRLFEKTDFSYDASQAKFDVVKKEQLQWGFDASTYADYMQILRYPANYYPLSTPIPNFFSAKYNLLGHKYLQQKTITEFFPGGDSSKMVTYYNYNGLNQLASDLTVDNENGMMVLENKYKYVTDNTLLSAAIKNDMQVKNIIAPLIETEKFIYEGQYMLPVTGSKTDYLKFGLAQNILPAKTYETGLSPSGSVQKLRGEIKMYTEQGNPLETVANNNFYTSYVWGYNERYIIAEAKNARHNEIFFTNFEDKAGWDAGLTIYDDAQSCTGNVSGRIDNVGSGELVTHSSQWLNIALPAAKKFRYSGWVYSNGPSADIFLFMKRNGEPGYFSYVDNVTTTQTGKWIYLEKEFLVPADVTQLNIRLDNNGGGSVWFDDIRLYPADAAMNTFTFTPLIGMTSEAGADGRPTLYSYDGLGRLSLVKDHQGNIINKYCYNFYGQTYNCDEANTVVYKTAVLPQWVPNGKTRCETDKTGNNTGYLQREEKDFRSTSNSFNTHRWIKTRQDIKACPFKQVFARIVYTNWHFIGSRSYADVEVRFFEDPEGAIPSRVEKMPIRYQVTRHNNSGSKAPDISVIADGFSTRVAKQVLLGDEDEQPLNWTFAAGKTTIGTWKPTATAAPLLATYQLAAGSGYSIIY